MKHGFIIDPNGGFVKGKTKDFFRFGKTGQKLFTILSKLQRIRRNIPAWRTAVYQRKGREEPLTAGKTVAFSRGIRYT